MAGKKIILPSSKLPPVNSNNGYLIRYRIVSEDKNRTSHWSPVYDVVANAPQLVDGTATAADGIVNVVWGDEAGRPSYDIFVRFDYNSGDPTPSEYFYHGTSQIHTYSFLYLGLATQQIDVIVQVASTEKEVSAALEIFSITLLI